MKCKKMFIGFAILLNTLQADDGDVVGRDGAVGFGHIGIMKDGYVFEMLNYSHCIFNDYFTKTTNIDDYEYSSNLHKNSFTSFKNTYDDFGVLNEFWGQRYSSLVEEKYKSRINNYINPWIEFTFAYGANYNFF